MPLPPEPPQSALMQTLAWSLPAARLHGPQPGAVRRRVQRPVRRLRAADGADLRPGRGQGPIYGAPQRAAAGTELLARTDPRRPLGPAARGRRAHRPPPADAARLPRRADALLRGGGRGDRHRRDRLLAARARVPDPRADAGGDAGGDPARRLRRRARGRGSTACGCCSATSWSRPARPGCSCAAWSRGAAGATRWRRCARGSPRSTRRSSPRSPSTACGPTWRSATTSSRC